MKTETERTGLKIFFDEITDLVPDIEKRHEIYEAAIKLSFSSFERGYDTAKTIYK